MGTIKEFCEKHLITIESLRVPENPRMPPDPKDKTSVQWHKEAGHFHCTLRRNKPNYHPADRAVLPTITTYYSMGSGHARRKYPSKGPNFPLPNPMIFPNPTVEQVLDCLASDASCWESNRTFEDFCAELGYDTDSRKAERVYQACGETYKKLQEWLRPLGRDVLHELLYETERL